MFEDLASAGSFTGTPQALLDDANKYKKDLYVADGKGGIVLNPNRPLDTPKPAAVAPDLVAKAKALDVLAKAPVPETQQPSFSQWGAVQQKMVTMRNAFLEYGGDGSGSFRDNTMWVLNQVRVFSPLTQAADAISVWAGGTDSRGIPKSNMDGAYCLAAGIPISAVESIIIRKIMPWSSRSVNLAAKAADRGSLDIWVKSQSEAEELFLGHFQRYGLKNATGMGSTEAKSFFGNNFYHWDTKFGKDGYLLYHSPKNPHSTIPHLQIHMKKNTVRVFWTP
jgi:hypothetical protein